MRVPTIRRRFASVCAGPAGGAPTLGGRRLGTRRPQIPQPHQVIRRGGEGELPIHPLDAAVPELAQPADGLQPPKDLFDELPFALTDVIARMPRRPAIDRTPLRQFSGDGRGYWEGDTLVVESTNFNGELTMIGTEPERLVERFSRLGDTIQYEFTVDDPNMWSTTWTARVPLRQTDDPLFEYACHEGNYSVENMLRIARGADRAVR